MVLALVVALSIALGVFSIVQQNRTACQQVNVLRSAIVAVLRHGEEALPRVPYYKAHPDQLAAAEANYQTDLRELGPVHC